MRPYKILALQSISPPDRKERHNMQETPGPAAILSSLNHLALRLYNKWAEAQGKGDETQARDLIFLLGKVKLLELQRKDAAWDRYALVAVGRNLDLLKTQADQLLTTPSAQQKLGL